jgi:lysozyme family protein
MAAKLKELIDEGMHGQAETQAAAYIEEYTRGVLRFFPNPEAANANPGIEFVLRDTCFNRGLKGAATVLQIALGMHHIDGLIGPMSREKFAHKLDDPGPAAVLAAITAARETYERNTYEWKPASRDEKSKFWKGLSNRWAKAHQVAGGFV